MTGSDLLNLTLKDYFEYFQNSLKKDVDLESLTRLFTKLPFKEKKPYLTRRLLLPEDNRFSEIEIVYDVLKSNKVGAIIWEFRSTFRELINLFGKPIIHYEPYSNSVVVAFKCDNPDIDVIKTRYSQSPDIMTELRKMESKDVKSIDNRLLELEFGFLQIDLRD